ncbi:MAG: VIT domain-containing protein, partial [bacterium]
MNKINQQRCQCWLTRFSGLIARYALLMLLLPVTGTAAERQLGSSDLRMLDMESGRQLQTILRSTEVDINISGMISRVVVRQTFANHSARWAEGEYVFPLPDNAAVDHLRMWIGDRFIEGDIMEKQKAERTYQQAREAGKRASLLRQERTNIFTSRVANIPPSSEIIIEIEYQQQVRYQRGEFSVRFPMVVAPRYIPGEVVDAELGGFSGNGWARNTDQVSDASRITPPVAMPASGPLNPVSMLINLHPGFEPAWVESAYHPVVIQENGTNGRVIELQAEAVPADRDFELRWAAHPGETPHAAYFSEDTGEAHHSMLMLVPPTLLGGTLPPRELILVVDTSGSMHGGSIDQARRALRLAIENLEPSDRFNIIQFNDRPSKLYRFPIDADQVNREDALDYIDELEADGGT